MERTIENKIKVYSSREDGLELQYLTNGSSGFDFPSNEDLVLNPGDIKLISTGFHFNLPKGTELQVRPRSGLASKHGITVLNTPGTVDSDYHGEVKLILINLGKEPFHIKVGDRVAQGVIVTGIFQYQFEYVSEKIHLVDNETSRGENGFGSTGV